MANLTPEQLALLYSRVTPTNAQGYIDFEASPYGRAYTPEWNDVGGTGTGEAYSPNSQITGWTVYDLPENAGDRGRGALNGSPYQVYDPSGNFQREGTFSGLKRSGVSNFIHSGGPVAMMAAPFAAAMFPGVNAALSFGANPVTGATAGGAGAAGAGGVGYGALGATEPVASIGAAGGMTQAELAAMGAGSSGLGGGSGAFLGEGVASGIPAWDAAATGAGLSLSGAGSSLAGALGGAAKWLGPAATLLGGLAGAQGQKTSQTSERKTDPRVDPYLFGNGDQMGLLGYAYNQLARDQSPERLAQRDQMRSTGMGLLSQPIAGNGFTRFFPGR